VQRTADEIACAGRPREEGNTRRFRGKVTGRSGKERYDREIVLLCNQTSNLFRSLFSLRDGQGRGAWKVKAVQHVPGGSAVAAAAMTDLRCAALSSSGEGNRGGGRRTGVEALLRESPLVLLDYSTREKYAASVWTAFSKLSIRPLTKET
jgi:hypothetical protein